MNTVRRYIIVDDDDFSNVLCAMMLKSTLRETEIQVFTNPAKALEFIQHTYNRKIEPTILLLDINMPILTGWDFMTQYERFDSEIKDQIVIYIHSSSVDERDMIKASNNVYIKGFILKPLEGKTILSMEFG
jgi:two-component SAPR family response regulator